MNWIDRLQALAFRLYGAAVVFWLAGAALDSVWLIQLMGACAFAALAVIPLRLAVVAVVALTDSVAGHRILDS